MLGVNDNATRHSGQCVQLSEQCPLTDSGLSQLIQNHALILAMRSVTTQNK